MTAAVPNSASPLSNGGFVSNEVIALQIKHMGDTMDVLRVQVVGELQMLRAESVRRDVYDQQRKTDALALEQVKEEVRQALLPIRDELKESRQRKWTVWMAVGVAVFALAKDVLADILKAGIS